MKCAHGRQLCTAKPQHVLGFSNLRFICGRWIKRKIETISTGCQSLMMHQLIVWKVCKDFEIDPVQILRVVPRPPIVEGSVPRCPLFLPKTMIGVSLFLGYPLLAVSTLLSVAAGN